MKVRCLSWGHIGIQKWCRILISPLGLKLPLSNPCPVLNFVISASYRSKKKKMVSDFNKPLGTKVIFVKSMFRSKFCNIRHHTDPRKLDTCHFSKNKFNVFQIHLQNVQHWQFSFLHRRFNEKGTDQCAWIDCTIPLNSPLLVEICQSNNTHG